MSQRPTSPRMEPPPAAPRRGERGIALVTVMMVSVVFSLMMVGFFMMVNGEQKISASDRDHTVAFYGAEAGMEKMDADLGAYFSRHTSPTAAEINALVTPSHEPVIPGVTFPAPGSADYPNGGYTVSFQTNSSGAIVSTDGTIGGTGPLAGLQGLITPFTQTIIAQGPNNTEVKMTRGIQEVSVPVFEFGIFSDTDLSFFAGPPFDFGGRVHTNGYLFLAEGDGGTLTMEDKVTSARDIIRTQLSNGWPTSDNYTGTVDVDTAPGVYRALASTEGSVTGGPGSSANGSWPTISLTTYNGNILNKLTGAKPLDLDLAVSGSADPIEIIRRPPPGEDPTSLLGQARLYNQASLQILIFDPTSESASYGPGDPLLAEGVTLDNSVATGFGGAWYNGGVFSACYPPIAESPGPVDLRTGVSPAALSIYAPYLQPVNTPLLGGSIANPARIVIMEQTAGGAFVDVTKDVLSQGIAPVSGTCANKPIVKLEQYAYNGQTSPPYSATSPYGYIPISIYDAREGELRDLAGACGGAGGVQGSPCVATGGIMDLVDLDVHNLQQYFNGSIGADGPNAVNNDGYIVYFSDRRGNVDPTGCVAGAAPYEAGCEYGTAADAQTAEYGNEDIVNPGCGLSTGCLPNGTLDHTADDFSDSNMTPTTNVSAEDVNLNGVLDTYGAIPDVLQPAELAGWTAGGLPVSAGATRSFPEVRVTAFEGAHTTCTSRSRSGSCLSSYTNTYPSIAQANPPLLFRRALRLVDGSLGNLPPALTASCGSATGGGFTVATENPVYVLGDYNANTANGFNDAGSQCHVPASVMADAVTLLSDNWARLGTGTTYYAGDQNSFTNPDSPGSRGGATTWFRMGVIAGKNLPFTHPSGTYQDFGTDGGVHNFLRFLEGWGGSTLNYRGSIVSLYFSRQATGIYKCCTTVYGAPSRGYHFDTDFEDISTLPPGTPRFTDINTLSFQQAVLENQ